MSFEIILIASIAIILNVLDSITTHICFKQYPDKELKGESNPFMRLIMLKSRLLAEIVKHVVLLAIVITIVLDNHLWSLKVITTLLGLAVINNAYIIITRQITKRKLLSPIRKFLLLLHIPAILSYPVVIGIFVGISILFVNYIWK